MAYYGVKERRMGSAYLLKTCTAALNAFYGGFVRCASLLNQIMCGVVTQQNRNSTLYFKLWLTIHIQPQMCQ